MATWSLESIEEKPFQEFVQSPTEVQLQTMAEAMSEDDHLEYMEEEPQWGEDIAGSVRTRLPLQDWYAGLAEEEMSAWDTGILALVSRKEFQRKHHGYHGAVGCDFLDLAAQMYEEQGTDAVVRRFFPFRYRGGYHSELEPQDRLYWPWHGLLSNQDVGKLLLEVHNYEAVFNELSRNHRAEWVDQFREDIAEDVNEAIPALTEILEAGRMWFGYLDC